MVRDQGRDHQVRIAIKEGRVRQNHIDIIADRVRGHLGDVVDQESANTREKGCEVGRENTPDTVAQPILLARTMQ